jgi:hypothetical protein
MQRTTAGFGVWGVGYGVWGVAGAKPTNQPCDGVPGPRLDWNSSEGGLAGDAEGGRIGEAREQNLGGGRIGMVGELEGKPAVCGGEFEGRDADAVDAESGELVV